VFTCLKNTDILWSNTNLINWLLTIMSTANPRKLTIQGYVFGLKGIDTMQSVRIRMKSLYRGAQNGFERLRHHEADAMRVHMDDLLMRATTAVQAGDFSTLVGDQIDLLPRSNESLRAHWLGLIAIAR
jgi:hypothetical protein